MPPRARAALSAAALAEMIVFAAASGFLRFPPKICAVAEIRMHSKTQIALRTATTRHSDFVGFFKCGYCSSSSMGEGSVSTFGFKSREYSRWHKTNTGLRNSKKATACHRRRRRVFASIRLFWRRPRRREYSRRLWALSFASRGGR
jgi:hypothetical protein